MFAVRQIKEPVDSILERRIARMPAGLFRPRFYVMLCGTQGGGKTTTAMRMIEESGVVFDEVHIVRPDDEDEDKLKNMPKAFREKTQVWRYKDVPQLLRDIKESNDAVKAANEERERIIQSNREVRERKARGEGFRMERVVKRRRGRRPQATFRRVEEEEEPVPPKQRRRERVLLLDDKTNQSDAGMFKMASRLRKQGVSVFWVVHGLKRLRREFRNLLTGAMLWKCNDEELKSMRDVFGGNMSFDEFKALHQRFTPTKLHSLKVDLTEVDEGKRYTGTTPIKN